LLPCSSSDSISRPARSRFTRSACSPATCSPILERGRDLLILADVQGRSGGGALQTRSCRDPALRATFATIAVMSLFVAGGADAANNLVAAGAVAPQQTAVAGTQREASNTDSIGAIVNSDIIADYDLRQRVALYLATAGVEPTPELMKKIRAQILDQLVTEKLQIQEAKRKNITISSPEIDKALNRIVDDNHITLDQLKQVLGKNGASVQALRSQLAAQILWQKVVEDEFQDRINISESEIDAEMARLEEGKNRAHFLVTEIFLAVDTPDQDAKVLRNIQDLATQ